MYWPFSTHDLLVLALERLTEMLGVGCQAFTWFILCMLFTNCWMFFTFPSTSTCFFPQNNKLVLKQFVLKFELMHSIQLIAFSGFCFVKFPKNEREFATNCALIISMAPISTLSFHRILCRLQEFLFITLSINSFLSITIDSPSRRYFSTN